MKNQQWDVFISAKSDDYGYAEQVFRHLSQVNLRPFFSKFSIVEAGDSDYLKIINQALDACSHMVVVASAACNITSPWVENEWSIFLTDILGKRKKGNLLTMLVGDLSVDDLPPSLRNRQVLFFSEAGLVELVRFVNYEVCKGDTDYDGKFQHNKLDEYQHANSHEVVYKENVLIGADSSESKRGKETTDIRIDNTQDDTDVEQENMINELQESARNAEARGKFTLSNALWQQSLDISPNDPVAAEAALRLTKVKELLRKASELESRENWPEASALLSNASQLCNNSYAFMDLLREFRERWVLAEAAKQQKEAEDNRLQELVNLRKNAANAEARGEFSSAYNYWQQYLALAPTDKDAKKNICCLKKVEELLKKVKKTESEGSWPEASALLSEASQISTNNVFLINSIKELRERWVIAESEDNRKNEEIRRSEVKKNHIDGDASRRLSIPEVGVSWVEPITGMEFVWLPGGNYKMGSPENEEGRNTSEGPVHSVSMDSFWIGKFAVTNYQYRRYKPTHDSGRFASYSLNDDKQPVVCVTWEDANAFAIWLTNNNNVKFQLPTEAQWEFAARAATSTSRYWGEYINEACVYANVWDITGKEKLGLPFLCHNCKTGYAVTAPVGSFKPNAFGLYDMLGNVKEWCSDIYASDAYRKHKMFNPEVISGGTERVTRGGDWHSPPKYVRSASRRGDNPSGSDIDLGFRLIINLT